MSLFPVVRRASYRVLFAAIATVQLVASACCGDEPPSINPFGPRNHQRADAIPGYVELSDDKVLAGRLYLTRDARLEIYDEAAKRQREFPLRAVRHIECHVEKEWMEREWRFKENANDQKVYTGRSYPARRYVHKLTLLDGREVTGPLSGILYVETAGQPKPTRLLMHKRQKGSLGSDLKSLVYVRRVELGPAKGKSEARTAKGK